MKPIFIPLKKEHFEAFERGEKIEEFRLFCRKWSRVNCFEGRKVTLGNGYSGRRLSGIIEGHRIEKDPSTLKGWVEIYGDKKPAVCIRIKVTP